MPKVDIVSLPMMREEKQDLVRNLTDALVQGCECPPENVAIRFREIDGDNYAAGGKLAGAFAAVVLGKPKNQIFEMDITYYRWEAYMHNDSPELLGAVTKTFPNLSPDCVEIHTERVDREMGKALRPVVMPLDRTS